MKKNRKKYWEAVVASIVILAFIMPGAFANFNTIVSINPSIQIVGKGEAFTISVYVVPSEPIIGVRFNYLYYNPDLIHANLVTEGDLFDNYTVFDSGIIDNNVGVITDVYLQASSQDAVNESGAFVDIEFTAQDQFGTSVLDLEEVTVINVSSVELPLVVNDGEVAVGWSVTLNFNETGGKIDYAVFGETVDADDGGIDSFDTPKPPEPIPPYLRAWFDDNLPLPYDVLLKDYRRYPDTNKIWNLSVQWESSSSDPIDVTISWDNSKFIDCEYNSIILLRYDPFEEEWTFAIDMLLNDNYVYAPRYFVVDWLTDRFKIIALSDTMPPEITDVILTPSDPIDVLPEFGWENISCIVTDNVSGVDEVKIFVTYPDDSVFEYPMINIVGTDIYYFNTTFTDPGYYDYYIWANDLLNNNGTSETQIFGLPPNWDVDKNGQCHFMDLVKIVLKYDEHGPDGWVREDVNNDGHAYYMDLVQVALHYGEYW